MRYLLMFAVLMLGCSEPTGLTYGVPEGRYEGKDGRNNDVLCNVIELSGGDFVADSLRLRCSPDSGYSHTYFLPPIPITMNVTCSFDYDTQTCYGTVVHVEATYSADSLCWVGFHEARWSNGHLDTVPFTMTRV